MPLSPLGGALDTAPAFATPTFDINPRPLSKVSAPNTMAASAFRVGDRIKDAVASVTPNLVTLAKANPSGFNNFKDGVGDGNATFYVLADTSGNWEAQYGLYSDDASTLTRSALPLSSSTSTGVQVVFSGPVTAFGNWPALAELATACGMAGGRYYGSIAQQGRGVGGVPTLPYRIAYFTPVFVGQAFATFQVGIRSGGNNAPALCDLGLYNTWAGAPYQLLGSQTGVSTVSPGAQLTSRIVPGQPLPPGWYWVGFLSQTPSGLSIFICNATTNAPLLGTDGTGDTTVCGYAWSGLSQLPLIVSTSSLAANSQAPMAIVAAGL
jgi:hypothetical protein